MDTQMCAKANTAQCLPHLHNFSTFMYIWMFHNKKLGGGGGRRQADLVVMLWLWDGLAMGIHEKGFWETMQHAAQPASHSLYQRPPSTCSMLQQKVVAHYHPTLAKIPESQAGMRLSSGSWWGPWARRRLMRYHLNPWEVLARRGLHLHPKLILPMQDDLNFMKQNQEIFNFITNSSKIYGPRACFNFLTSS